MEAIRQFNLHLPDNLSFSEYIVSLKENLKNHSSFDTILYLIGEQTNNVSFSAPFKFSSTDFEIKPDGLFISKDTIIDQLPSSELTNLVMKYIIFGYDDYMKVHTRCLADDWV